MIKQEEVEKAAAYLRDNAAGYAKAKAERIYLHEFRKSSKAMLMNEKTGEPEHVRASYAYAHKDYQELLEGLRAAIEEEERLNWMMKAAVIKCDLWRTEQASNRTIDRAHQ